MYSILTRFLLLGLRPFSAVLASQSTAKIIASRDGTSIYADATGNPAKQSIVFVHGLALSGIVFDNFFANDRLRENYYLVRYDARGHGRSGKPSDAEAYASVHYAEDFLAVAHAFRLNKPVFVGWSLGSAIISDIVEHINPLPILGAVTFAGSPVLGPEILPKLISPSINDVLSAIFQDSNVTACMEGRIQFIDACFRDATQVPFDLKATYLGQTVVQPPTVALLSLQRTQDPTRLFAAGQAGTLRLQQIFGDADRIANNSAAVEFVKPHFNFLTVDTIPAGHAMFEDSPERTVDALTRFIRSLPRKR
ncbi:alpha/beta-hydrolase [Pleurotus eryngii]|uniref:Alpha/beta-hydrolase n=1 Tax=Pleurotus eryngii TaxID=5323 RepID=A0A9P6DA20_PLEER|nr:alpha/beta-hydrolase [Pleurotus eryngii]